MSCPDFLQVAAAFGIRATKLENFEDAPAVISDTLSGDGPVICVVYTDPEQIFVPKLSLSVDSEGKLVSPPLEDLAPLLPREQLGREMLVGVHEKSRNLEAEK